MKGKLRKSMVCLFVLTLFLTSLSFGSGSVKAAEFEEDVSVKNVSAAANVVSATIVSNREDAVSFQFMAVLYDEHNALMDAKAQTVTLGAKGASTQVSATFGATVDPAKHTIKLFAWNDLVKREPLSYVVTIHPSAGGMSEVTDKYVDPYSFYVGKVVRSFSDTENKALSIDLANYIDHDRKILKSVTGETEWDYNKGVVELNTPETQGVTGILNSVDRFQLKDVAIESQNEFGTIIVISMDGQPIAASRKLMIQAMTEDRPYGYQEEKEIKDGKETGYLKINNIGTGPMNVKNIAAKVTFKNMTDVTKVYKLNENGYVKAELAGQSSTAGYEIQLASDAMYTIVERQGLANPYVPSSGDNPAPPTFVWWEGEDFTETNFPWETSSFAASTFPTTRNLLSGDRQEWLSISSQPQDGQTPYAKYTIQVPSDGDYNFFTRKFWQHGPFYWRFDGASEWNYVGRNITLLDKVTFRQFLEANWVNMGSYPLTAGTHTFELKLDLQPGENPTAAFDSFVLVKEPFQPRGKLKPGEKMNLAEPGSWSFEPELDHFGASAQIDLRYLNESQAGVNGHVRKEGDKLVYGDGREAKFWGINAGVGVTNLQKGDIDYLARRLAKSGVNMVRLHGMIFDENGNISDTALDKYHYFVSAMKKQGIYVNLSYYFILWWDMTKASDFQAPGYQYSAGDKNPFALIQFSDKQQQVYMKGVSKLLLSPNPYEDGLPLAKDPAVAVLEIQNEDNYLFWTFDPKRFPEQVRKEFFQLFGQWATQQYGSIEQAYAAWGEGSQMAEDMPAQGVLQVEPIFNLSHDTQTKRRSDTLRFLVENQRGFYEKMTSFLRNEIKTESLISSSNWITAHPERLEALERYTYGAGDIVDRHAYFESNHVTDTFYMIKNGDKYRPEPAVLNPGINPVKIVHNEGQPSMISEVTWTNPTKYGAEGPFMLAVYGAQQGIDLIDMFAVGGPGWPMTWEKWPVMSPTMMGQFPAFALMYRQGYVTEAPAVVHETNTLDALYHHSGSKIFETLNLDDARK